MKVLSAEDTQKEYERQRKLIKAAFEAIGVRVEVIPVILPTAINWKIHHVSHDFPFCSINSGNLDNFEWTYQMWHMGEEKSSAYQSFEVCLKDLCKLMAEKRINKAIANNKILK